MYRNILHHVDLIKIVPARGCDIQKKNLIKYLPHTHILIKKAPN